MAKKQPEQVTEPVEQSDAVAFQTAAVPMKDSASELTQQQFADLNASKPAVPVAYEIRCRLDAKDGYRRAGLSLNREPQTFTGLTDAQLERLRADKRVAIREV